MKNNPKPLLQSSVDAFPDEEWRFLRKEHYQRIIDKGWTEEFLNYELSREASRGDDGMSVPMDYLQNSIEGNFPDTPFLKISQQGQQNLVAALQEADFPHRARAYTQPAVIHYTLSPCLKDEVSEHLENHGAAVAIAEAKKWEGLDPSWLLPLTNPGEKAITEERNRLITTHARGDEIFEPDLFQVQLLLDFGYTDTLILQRFKELLEEFRESKARRELDGRGRTTSPTVKLRQLAAFRLKRHCGSFAHVEEFLNKKRIENPYTSESGWNKAVKGGEEMVNKFKQRFAVKGEPGIEEPE